MLGQVRKVLREALPPRLVHAYRVARHAGLWPAEMEMVAARQFLSGQEIAIDVGANFGLFTSVLARHAKGVVAFEPNPDCARYLSDVMRANCEIIAKAVSDTVGSAVLRVPLANGVAMNALASIETANRFDTEGRVTDLTELAVETVTLDQILLDPARSIARVGFINIDAEGHEFAVLRGGEKVIAAQRPVLLIELEYRHGSAIPEVFDWLAVRGYEAQALIDERTLSPIDPVALRNLQSAERLDRRLAGHRHSGYVNNIFFLPVEGRH